MASFFDSGFSPGFSSGFSSFHDRYFSSGFEDMRSKFFEDNWFDFGPEEKIKEEELDAYDLQRTLNRSYRKEFKFEGFSLETCRSMVALMDTDMSGKLGRDEFQELTKLITYWKNIFHQYDQNGDGVMNERELRQGFQSAGYQVSNHLLDLLIKRYGNKKGIISFDDFIHCAMKLSIMIDEFKARDLGRKNIATFSKEEWLVLNMYS